LENQTLHNAEHVLFLDVGYLFFLPLLGQEPIKWRVSYPIRLLVLAVAMPVDTFTGLVLGYAGRGDVVPTGPRPPGAPAPVQDLHWAGAIMWIGGDAIMLAFIMIAVWMWSRDDRASLGGWLEAARKSQFDELVAGQAAGSPAVPAARGPAAGAASRPVRDGGIDDDEHLAAYNEYLARLSAAPRDAGRRQP
jgi:putative copper resistance protein D